MLGLSNGAKTKKEKSGMLITVTPQGKESSKQEAHPRGELRFILERSTHPSEREDFLILRKNTELPLKNSWKPTLNLG
jgi:hypothetical protein